MTSRSLTEMVSLHLPRHAACAPHSVLECACVCKTRPSLEQPVRGARSGWKPLTVGLERCAKTGTSRGPIGPTLVQAAQYLPLAEILAWSSWSKWSKHFFTTK